MNAQVVADIIRDKRLGQFKLPTALIQSNPAAMLQLMGHTLVVQAVFTPQDGCIAYVAYSEYFDMRQEGEVAPEYMALVGGGGRGRFLGFSRRSRMGLGDRRGPGYGYSGMDRRAGGATASTVSAPAP